MSIHESEEDVKKLLIKFLNKLKVFREESSFDSDLKDLVSFIKEKKISTEILGEVLGGFIIERCDNMLANISVSDSLRACVHKLAREAYKLYIYSAIKRMLQRNDVFVKYVLELKEGLRIEANSIDEIKKKLQEEISNRLMKVLCEEGIKLARSIVIDNESKLEELLPLIKHALSKGVIELVLVPNTTDIPLFFKEYYSSVTDHSKVKCIAIALDKIIRSFKPYFNSDEIAYDYINTLERIVRNILGSEPLDKYILRSNTKNYNDYIMEVTRVGASVRIKLMDNNNNVICDCKDWPEFWNCIDSNMQSLLSSDVMNCLWNKIYRDLLRSDAIQNRYKLINLLKTCLSELLHEAVNYVLRKNDVRIIKVLERKVVVKPSYKNLEYYLSDDAIVINVHTKNDDRIEIAIGNEVHQVPKSRLEVFIRKDLVRKLDVVFS